MADLEDAENAIAKQETWGLNQTGLAVKQLAKAARVIRNVLTTYASRFADIESRLSAVEAQVAVPATPVTDPVVDPPTDPPPDPIV
jgi:hypothetical protein